MKRTRSRQYTIRAVPEALDRALRLRAKRENKSLNEVALDALKTGAGLQDSGPVFTDLDWCIGTWVEDPEFDKALMLQDRVDRRLWH